MGKASIDTGLCKGKRIFIHKESKLRDGQGRHFALRIVLRSLIILTTVAPSLNERQALIRLLLYLRHRQGFSHDT